MKRRFQNMFVVVLFLSGALFTTELLAHGPQIQLTGETGKIVTREVVLDGPYSDSLTSPKSVYVMPVLPYNGAWYSRPNTEVDALDPSVPVFYSGPGYAYGYDQADGGPQTFPVGSKFLLTLTNGLKKWNGTAFEDGGTAEFEAFRGTTAVRTVDGGASAPLDFPPDGFTAGYGDEGAEVHNTIRYRFLGDGSSTSSPLADGVYLMGLQLTTPDAALSASDPFYFVLNKNGSADSVAGAVKSLGFAQSAIQFVPEPVCGLQFVTMMCVTLCGLLRRL